MTINELKKIILREILENTPLGQGEDSMFRHDPQMETFVIRTIDDKEQFIVSIEKVGNPLQIPTPVQ